VLQPLGIRDFALLWTGMTVSLLGDGIYLVTIAWQVYELSNVPTALSVVGIAWTVPNVLLLLVGGVLSDRIDRRRLMMVSDVVRGIAIGAIGFLALADALELWHLLLLVAVYGAGEALFAPAFNAIVPDIVPGEQLVQANSLDMLVRPLTTQLAGPALGGILIAAIGTGGAFLLDGASFAISFACLLVISPRPLPVRDPESPSSMAREIGEGFRFVRSQTWLWGTLAAAAVFLLVFYGPSQVLLPFVVKNDLGGSARDYGFVLASAGIGAIGAALVVGQRALPRRQITVMYASWTLAAALIVVWGIASELWQMMIASVVRGAGATVGMVIWMTLMQTRVPRTLLGRVSSLDWLVSIGLIPVSFALTGPIAAAAGARETLVGAGLLGATITIAFLFVPGMRDPERDG
jgi:DHA3 family tetracycline resistance protein-like MFS transporter